MQYLIGFLIALFIALTGVGAGTVTVPVLILFLGVPAGVAVGIGLILLCYRRWKSADVDRFDSMAG